MSAQTDELVAGRYRLGQRLGTGGMADVYEAVDERLSRPVAVKMLRLEVSAQHPEVRDRFEAEARNAARLSHPNVVAVYDTGEHEGVPYIVMERLPGETLAAHVADGPVDLAWLRRVAGDVLGALGAAHAAGIVHRDIKPGNILIAGDGCAKVADFGIAKSLEAAGPDLTGTNLLVGTPAYMAPERVMGEPATTRSDLYSLGVVLYEAAAGQKPFTGPTPVALAYAIRNGEVQPLRELRPDVDATMAAVVEQAMAVDPATRFATAAAMATALGVAGDTETVAMAVPDSTTTAAAPLAASTAAAPLWWNRREVRWAAVVVIGIVILLAVAAAAANGKDDTAGSSPTTTAPPPPPTTAQAVVTTTPAPPVSVQVRVGGRTNDQQAPRRPRAERPKGKKGH